MEQQSECEVNSRREMSDILGKVEQQSNEHYSSEWHSICDENQSLSDTLEQNTPQKAIAKLQLILSFMQAMKLSRSHTRLIEEIRTDDEHCSSIVSHTQWWQCYKKTIEDVVEEETKISDILSKCERILQNVENEDSDELCVGPVDKQVLAQLVKQQFRIKKQYTLPAYRVLSAECEDPVRCLSINSLGSIILADQSNNLQVIFPKQGAKRDKSKHGDVLAMKWLSLSKFLVAYSSGTIILYNRALKQLLSVDTAMSDVLLSRINILDVDSPSTLVECISQNSFKSVFYHKLTFTEFSSNILLQDRCFHSSHRFLELLKFERESTDCVSSQKLCRNPLRGMFLVGLTASKKKIIKIDMAIEEEGNIYECRQELIHHILVDEHKTSLLMQNSILMLCEKTAGVYSLKRLSLNGETLKQYSLNMQGQLIKSAKLIPNSYKLKLRSFELMEEGQVACFCIKNCIVYFSLLSEKVIFSYENDNNDSLKLLEATKGGNLAVVRGNFVEIISKQDADFKLIQIERQPRFLSTINITQVREIPQHLMMLLRTLRQTNPQMLETI